MSSMHHSESPGLREPTGESTSRKRRRRNVSRACDRCKLKKIRCDGLLPCIACSKARLDEPCAFEAPNSRGLGPPAIPSRSYRRITEDETGTSGVSDQLAFDSRNPSPGVEHVEGLVGQSSNIAFSHAARLQLGTSCHDRSITGTQEGPISTYPEERAVQASVGLQDQASLSERSWLYFSEPPFPPLKLTNFSIPPLQRALELSVWYFENASPTYRFLHRHSVERSMVSICAANSWLGPDIVDESPAGDTERCIAFMVWAIACQYPRPQAGRAFSNANKRWLQDKGVNFYQAAKSTLDDAAVGVDRLNILHVRLLMVLYLLTSSRLKAAWDMFATVKNMANNLDLMRPLHHGPGEQTPVANLNTELRNRAFWAIYTLDTYLSAMLGKSLTFDERDIRIDHSTTDDTSLEHGINNNFVDVHQDDELPSLMLAPMAHAKLAQIIRHALRDLYLSPVSSVTRSQAVDQLSNSMSQWDQELPDFLKIRNGGLLHIYSRQATVIKLAQQHALILIYRPSLPLSGLAQSPPSGFRSPNAVERVYQDRCLDAANVVYETVSNLVKRGHINSQYWFSAYINFCAATVMLVYAAHNSTEPRSQDIWHTAQDCIRLERQLMTTANRLARRYVAALEDLSSQIHKRFSFPTNVPTQQSQSAMDVPQPSLNVQHDIPQTGSDIVGSFWATGHGMTWTDPNYAWDQLFNGSDPGEASFFDLDSLVSGGMNFGW